MTLRLKRAAALRWDQLAAATYSKSYGRAGLMSTSAALEGLPEPPAGDQLLLLCADPLERVLLPHLTAKEIFKLGCVCKSVHRWMLSLPPTTWQV